MNDDECLQAIRAGGDKRMRGISELYRRYETPFKRYFRKNGAGFVESEDLLQDTFVNVVKSCDRFRGDCEIRLWLWKIARNTLYGKARKPALPKAEPDDISNEVADNNQTTHPPGLSLEDCVRQAFVKFSREYRERAEILMLASIEGWSTSELAVVLDRTLGATREYISQCRKHFKPFLNECQDYL